MSHHVHHNDTKAAFTGLIIGAIALLIMVFGIVKWTNSQFAGHKAAAETTH